MQTMDPPGSATEPPPQVEDSADATSSQSWVWALVIVGISMVVNIAWLYGNRRWGLLGLDEAGYIRLASRVGHSQDPAGFWGALQEGVHGPMQALLAAPAQFLFGVNPRALFVENILFAGGTGLAVFHTTRRLAGGLAPLVATVLVVAAGSIIDFARTALTVMPSVFFAALAMTAVVHSEGLRRTRWVLVAGVALGAMPLGRTMAIAFVPPVCIAALGWAFADRTNAVTVVRKLAAGLAAAAAVAGWYWVVRGDAVADYLFGGGSGTAANASVESGLPQFTQRLDELMFAVGPAGWVLFFGTIFVAGWHLLRRIRGAPHTGRAVAAGMAPVWPMWTAIITAWLIVGASTVTGVGFLVPAVPWVVVASVASFWRVTNDFVWRGWALAAVASALIFAGVLTVNGIETNRGWCKAGAVQIDQTPFSTDPVVSGFYRCEIGGPETERWETAIDQVTDQLISVTDARRTEGNEPVIAVATRDWIVSPNAIAESAQTRHQWGADLSTLADTGVPQREQIRGLLEKADIVVTVPDRGDTVINFEQPPPATVATRAKANGFVQCGAVDLPDRRTMEVVAKGSGGAAACA